MPTSTTTLSPDGEPGPLLALALCSLEGLPIGRGKEGIVQSGSAARRWSDRLPWNPAQARTQRQQLRAAVSHSLHKAPQAPPLSPCLELKPSREELPGTGGGAGTGEGRAASQRLWATPNNMSGRGMGSHLEEDGRHCFHRGAPWENPGCLL